MGEGEPRFDTFSEGKKVLPEKKESTKDYIEVELPDDFHIEVSQKDGWPSNVMRELLKDKQPDRAVVTGGHFIVSEIIAGNKRLALPQIYTDIPLSAQNQGTEIIARYEMPLLNQENQWTLQHVEKHYSLNDKHLAAQVAALVSEGNTEIQEFRDALKNSIAGYPIYSFIQSLEAYKQVKMSTADTSYEIIVNDWQKLIGEGLEKAQEGQLSPRKKFWQEFKPADLISFQEITKSMGLENMSIDLISEQSMRSRVGKYFKKLAKQQNASRLSSGEAVAYGFMDKTDEKILTFQVCGSAGCNAEVMELVHNLISRRAKSNNERVVMLNFVPYTCCNPVDHGTQYGLKFSKLRHQETNQSKMPFPKDITVANFYVGDIPLASGLSRLNGNQQFGVDIHPASRDIYSLIETTQ